MLTDKGLMKYNGHSAKFYPATKDSSGLLHLPLYSLYIDKQGVIWIGYLEIALTSFDPKTEKFTHYFNNEKDPTSYPPGGAVHFMEDKKGELWIAVWGGGLAHFNRQTKKFKTYTSTKEEAAADPTRISTHNCTYVVEMPDGKFMVGTWEGEGFKNSTVQHFDPVTEKFSRFDLGKYKYVNNSEKDVMRSAFRIVHFIYPAPDKKIWIGSFIGLICVDEEAMTIQRISGVGGKFDGSGKYENAMDYLVDNNGQLWISTEVAGIMTIDPVSKKCAYINHQYKNSTTIRGDNIFSMFKDEDDNIWITTSGGGVDIYTPLLQQFKFEDNESLEAEKTNRAQGQTALHHLTFSKNSADIYLSHGNGLTVYNPVTDSSWRIDCREVLKKNVGKTGLKDLHQNSNHVFSVHEYGNKVCIANGHGPIIYDKVKKTFDFSLFKDYQVIDIERNKYGFVAFARNKAAKDYNIRLVHFDTNFKFVKELHYPEWPFPDMQGHINGGFVQPLGEHHWYINLNQRAFYIYNEENSEFKMYCARKECNNNFPDSMLTPLTKDMDDNLWMLGNNGIHKFDYRTGKTENYTDRFKLAIGKELIMSLTFDTEGYAWLALKQDLIRYNMKTGESFRFTHRLGLNVGGFSKVATYFNERKEIYMMSSYGLLHFDPHKLNFTRKKPDIFISGIIINKDTLNTKAFSSFMDSEHSLDHDQNHLTIEYATYQLYTPGPKKYEYRLLGLDSAWYNNEDRNYVSYSSLSPGSYILELKCLNVYGVNSAVTTFTFVIQPPIWKRWWFIAAEIILIALLIWGYIKQRERKHLADKEKLERTVTERTKEVVEKAKEIEMQNEIIFEKNKELTDSIKYAKRIQTALLANAEFMKEHLPPHFVFFKPKAIVSGDFYWATKVSGGSNSELFYLMVGDCTGHGVPGAFMSLLNISFLNEAISQQNILEPNKVLDYVRAKLISNLSADKGSDGMDGTLVCFNKKAKSFTYASAHNKPVLIRNGVMQELPADKMPIGKGERSDPFTLQTVQIQKGDSIYFYSDGYADQFGGPKGKKFKYRQLNEILVQICNKPVEEQKQFLYDAFEKWRDNLEQIDDVMVIGFKL